MGGAMKEEERQWLGQVVEGAAGAHGITSCSELLDQGNFRVACSQPASGTRRKLGVVKHPGHPFPSVQNS